MKSINLVWIIRSVTLILYFFIAAQGAFYLLGFGKALYNISSDTFIELRKAVDPVIRGRLKTLYLATLAMTFVWFLLTDKSGGFASYGLILVSFLLLTTDIFLILKVSEPVNVEINVIDTFTVKRSVFLQQEWLKYILIRAGISVSGFLLLLLQVTLRLNHH
jgi:hypothetical protein